MSALSCKRKRGRWWMHEINKKRDRFGEYHLQLLSQGSCTPGDLYRTKNTYCRTFSINFSVNSSAIPYCPLVKSVSRTQMSAARRDLDWSAALARLPFDGDDALLHNTVPMPSCCGHRSLPAAVACFLCGRTLSHTFGDNGVARRA